MNISDKVVNNNEIIDDLYDEDKIYTDEIFTKKVDVISNRSEINNANELVHNEN